MSKRKLIQDNTEHRLYAPNQKFELRTEQNGNHVIKGYAALFNSPSVFMGWTEFLVPGCFTETLRNFPDLRCFMNHDSSKVLGRVNAGTLTVGQDNKGLWFQCTLPNTTYANDLYESMKRGDTDQCSFAMIVAEDGDDWSNDKHGNPVRHISNIYRCTEVTITTMGAYPETSSSVVRNALRNAPAKIRAKLAKRDDDQLFGDLDSGAPDSGGDIDDSDSGAEYCSLCPCSDCTSQRAAYGDDSYEGEGCSRCPCTRCESRDFGDDGQRIASGYPTKKKPQRKVVAPLGERSQKLLLDLLHRRMKS